MREALCDIYTQYKDNIKTMTVDKLHVPTPLKLADILFNYY